MAELRNDLAAWRILIAAVRTGSIRATALQADLPAAKVSRIMRSSSANSDSSSSTARRVR